MEVVLSVYNFPNIRNTRFRFGTPTASVSCSLDISPEVHVQYLIISQSKFRAHCMQSTNVKHQ